MSIYDIIGKGYSHTRKSDPRIASAILNILKSAPVSTIADIGAGTGSYAYVLANHGYNVVAIEPSETMRSQALAHPNVNWVDASAESLPLLDRSVDAAIVILAMHHFKNYRQALSEAYRVTSTGLIIIFTYDPDVISDFWLTNYFPSLITDVKTTFVSVPRLVSDLEDITNKVVTIQPFPLPNDLIDSFAAVGWAKPELYLDSKIRQGISAFSKIETVELNDGLLSLKEDLSSGKWHYRYGYLRQQNNYDVGYRFIYNKI